ncbi:hypothetical protein LOZ65_001072 [Ophidiomyces ophidiicola]|nr:hypothetical protein LOZ65_001072 [Ophidiomyces ophidiicola]
MAENFRCPASSHARLSQLAAEAGVPVDSQSPLHKKELAFFIVESDKRESENLMKRIRQQVFSSKSHTFRRSPSRRGFMNHELHAAIETLIQDDGPIGVLACLLDKVREAKAKRKLFKLFEDEELDLSNFLRFAAEKRRLDMMDLLAPHVDLSALNTSLQSAATMLDIDCVTILLRHGADPNFCQSAFLTIVQNNNLHLAQIFLRSPKTLSTSCLDDALPLAVSNCALQLCVALLKQGANADLGTAFETVVRNGTPDFVAAFVSAKRSPSPVSLDRALGIILGKFWVIGPEQRFIVEILLCGGANGGNTTEALIRAVVTGWLSDAGLSSIKLLLEHGAFGDALNVALIMAIEAMEIKPEAEQFVELFLQFEASVDFRDGCALQTAITRGKSSLVRKLVQANPSDMTLMIGLSCVLNLDIHEDMVLDIIGILCKGNLDIRALNTAWHLNEPKEKSPLFLCIRRWPCSTRVLMKLLTSGMDANESILHLIPGEYDSEHISLLQWAILQRASPDVIECLMKYGAEPNFQSTKTWKTPIIIAAISCDPKVVLMLIQHGSDPSGCDKTGQTALLYACKNNQIQIMRHLLSAGATANDGSLHESSQGLNVEAIKLLISYGHNPNLPSMLHDGRSPLATLCFNCSDTISSISKLRQVLDLLILSKADLRASIMRLDRELADEREARTERLSKQQLYLESELAAQQARFAEQNRTRELEHSEIFAQRDKVRTTQKEQLCQMEGDLANKKWNMESLLIKELDAAKGRQYERDMELLKLQQSTLMGRQINRDFGVNSGSVGDEYKRLTFAGDELD